MPQATMLFASLLTLLYLYLTVRVIRARHRHRQAYGSTDAQPDLQLAVRAHGNFAEYTPLFLILLFIEETAFHHETLCYVLGTIFLCGRLMHAYSFLVHEPKHMPTGTRFFQVFGFRSSSVVLTFFTLGGLAILLLVQYVTAMTVA